MNNDDQNNTDIHHKLSVRKFVILQLRQVQVDAAMLLRHFDDLIHSQALDMGAWIIITSFIFKAYILLYYHRSLSSCRQWCRVWNLSFIEPLVEDSNGLSSKWFCISLSWFFLLLMLPANLVRFLDQFLPFWMLNFY